MCLQTSQRKNFIPLLLVGINKDPNLNSSKTTEGPEQGPSKGIQNTKLINTSRRGGETFAGKLKTSPKWLFFIRS